MHFEIQWSSLDVQRLKGETRKGTAALKRWSSEQSSWMGGYRMNHVPVETYIPLDGMVA